MLQLGKTYKLQVKVTDVCPATVGANFELREIAIVAIGKILSQNK